MADEIIDKRELSGGSEIPSEWYSDQPYVVRTDDGAWLCVLTTGPQEEGARGQHVVTSRSTDKGKTWEPPVAVEPSDGPEASYAVLLKAPGGRVYCFYNHNTDNLRQVKADDPPFKGGFCTRVDSQGHFVFKYSDDHGRTWSDKRWDIPMRLMEIDRSNAYGGEVLFFWNVGKAFTHDGAAYVPLHKVGGFGEGFFTRSEGVLLRSDNLLTEKDPDKIHWETLPEGDYGLRTPPGGGKISEEQSTVVLSDGSFFCVYRTIDGHPACCYSRDAGRTWTEPQYMHFADGRLVKHPRAANFVWKCGNGNYLYWFHNHGGTWYEDRNPVWLSGGVERDSPEGKWIDWSEPEIALYDDDTFVRISYPDLVEEDGKYYLTETQKDIARIHEVDGELVRGLWSQFDAKPSKSALKPLLSLEGTDGKPLTATEAAMPKLPAFITRDHHRANQGTKDLRAGFALELRLRLDRPQPGRIVLDDRTPDGRGLTLRIGEGETLEIAMNDGRTESRWHTDRGVLQSGKTHHVVVLVDGGPKIVAFVVDGKLCDGGTSRQFGWGRFSPHLRDARGSGRLRIPAAEEVELYALNVYGRCLRVSEAVGNYRAS